MKKITVQKKPLRRPRKHKSGLFIAAFLAQLTALPGPVLSASEVNESQRLAQLSGQPPLKTKADQDERTPLEKRAAAEMKTAGDAKQQSKDQMAEQQAKKQKKSFEENQVPASIQPAEKQQTAIILKRLETLYIPKHWTDPVTGIAIGGFDPITYFEQEKMQAGDAEFEHVWHGVSWRFVSKGNMQAFARSPTLYAPVFAGYDAYSLSKGILAEGLPSIWMISQGRLYLFHNPVNRHLWAEEGRALQETVKEKWKTLSLDIPRFKISPPQ